MILHTRNVAAVCAVVLVGAVSLPAQTPTTQPAAPRVTITQVNLLSGGEQVQTDGTLLQATRFGSNTEDITAFGIKWAKWPGSPAAVFPGQWGRNTSGTVDAKGAKFTGAAEELMKWIIGPNYGSITGTFTGLKRGARYRAQFLVNEDHPTRDLAVSVAGTSTGVMVGHTHPQVVTFTWVATRMDEPWAMTGGNGLAVGFALHQLPDPVRPQMNAEARPPAIIPAPRSCALTGGALTLTAKSRIVAGKAELMPLAKILAAEIKQLAGLALEASEKSGGAGDIELTLDSGLKDEAYRIEVGKRATVTAGTPAAVALASTTLLQSLSPGEGGVVIPRMTVQDAPAVGYRGLMIDCARQWHSIGVLKQMVILCRWYKVRYLQLHLSDDERFTFPSTAFPQLATKDQHYSLADLRDLETFARDRGVTIVPEIDVPGHATAMVKAQAFGGGGNVIGAGREETYKALDTLMGELCDVFRSTPYIHIGGDEVNKGAWNTPEAAAYMTAHKLADTEELYRHFIVRMNEIVKKHGRKTIVWEGFAKTGKVEIPKDITVMAYEIAYYQPDELVKDGYNIVNASWTPLYVVNANCREPEEIYSCNLFRFKKFKAPAADPGVNLPPTPKVLGAQMCAWEQPELQELPSLRHRLAAMSERAWNPDAGRAFADFSQRLRAADAGVSLLMP
ncbi:MAG: beta-N-acetylhexosaminidase [Planctomycetota bacterium]|nr:beta-N-acetylhexosaminidase [Planctomycetota bacterium]